VTDASPPVSKVVLDKALSTVLIVVSSPAWLAILVATSVERALSRRARGGLFHTELRVSGGQTFRLYKFRILTSEGEEKIRSGARPKEVENDPSNLTRVGSLLKKVGLDEMPQLLHVLSGTMSLVGPRPKPVREYHEEIERGHTFRAQLRAGLTGPSQVLKGTDPKMRRAVEDEFEYLDLLQRGSQWEVLRTDLGIIRRTVSVLLRATGE
jgi:lipopolysaccharide/colanic/teichoic acid biosynthesis glycosyltransferase